MVAQADNQGVSALNTEDLARRQAKLTEYLKEAERGLGALEASLAFYNGDLMVVLTLLRLHLDELRAIAVDPTQRKELLIEISDQMCKVVKQINVLTGTSLRLSRERKESEKAAGVAHCSLEPQERGASITVRCAVD